jgi:hypothetical protein
MSESLVIWYRYNKKLSRHGVLCVLWGMLKIYGGERMMAESQNIEWKESSK